MERENALYVPAPRSRERPKVNTWSAIQHTAGSRNRIGINEERDIEEEAAGLSGGEVHEFERESLFLDGPRRVPHLLVHLVRPGLRAPARTV